MKPSPREKKTKASTLSETLTANEQGQVQQQASQEKSKRIRIRPRDIHQNQLDSNRTRIGKSFTFAGVENIRRFETIRDQSPDESILFNSSTVSFGEIDDPYDDSIDRMALEDSMRALMNIVKDKEERTNQIMAETRRSQATSSYQLTSTLPIPITNSTFHFQFQSRNVLI